MMNIFNYDGCQKSVSRYRIIQHPVLPHAPVAENIFEMRPMARPSGSKP